MEAISNKQSELDNYIAEGYKNALSEERRRYCFLVDRQCAVAKNSSAYHGKVRRATRAVRLVPLCWCWSRTKAGLFCSASAHLSERKML